MESLDISGNDQDFGFEAVADHVREAVRGAAPAAEHLVPFGGSMVNKMHGVAVEMGREEQAENRLIDGFDHAIHEQPSALGAGVDLAPITAAEPDFDAFNFRTLARETFLKIREARGCQRRHAGDGLLSPSMEQEVNNVIDGDVAAHRHHILAQLEVLDATIASASFADGREKIGMRFLFGAEEIERDAATEAIVADDHIVHQWAELWQFERNPALHPEATDEQHIMSFGPDRWLFAHRGWVVTDIKRLEGAAPAPAVVAAAVVASPSQGPVQAPPPGPVLT